MNRDLLLACLALAGLVGHFFYPTVPLLIVLAVGSPLLLGDLLRKAWRGEFGSDLLAGISIITSLCLGQYLAGAVIVLMLSGGEALEHYAVGRASAVLEALARRMPLRARRRDGQEVSVTEIEPGDLLLLPPHEIAPVDAVVVEGRGRMDESFLTGEPYESSKVCGSNVLSGAINGDTALVIRATRPAHDSRYAKIMRVMSESEQHRPRLRRLGDRLGAIYTPIGVAIALLAWLASGDPLRFLSVLVIATPCPLLIGIPVAIIGAISLSARRGIIVRDPAILERISTCRTMILDKTGTLTYGRPELTDLEVLEFSHDQCLRWAATLERYSRHPLAAAVTRAAEQAGLALEEAREIEEPPGQGLRGTVDGHSLALTSRKGCEGQSLPAPREGLEAILVVDGQPAAILHFHDQPRGETRPFLHHLRGRHGIEKLLIVSGDRAGAVQFLADQVGFDTATAQSEVHGGKSPEEKVAVVRLETALAPTLYIGDGINDGPALAVATVGLALGQHSDVAAEAAGAVVLDSSLTKVDELMHIGQRMRTIALQSAVGGMTLSVLGMLAAAAGWLNPVQGAIGQELIDLVAVLNALRTSLPPARLTDYE